MMTKLNNFKQGVTVRNLVTNDVGRVSMTSRGVKVSGRKEDGTVWRTSRMPAEVMTHYWDVIV